MENYVYMTLLTNNTYVQGVILLNETLKQVNSKYPLVVLVTNDVAQATLDILDYLKIQWKLVENVKIPKQLQKLQQEQKIKYIAPYNVLTKLQIYYQFNYDKIMYLDSDLMILKNLDFLFIDNNQFTCTKNFQYQRDMGNKIFIENNKQIKPFDLNHWHFSDRINTGFLLFSPKNENLDLINFLNLLNENNFKKDKFLEQRVESDETILQLYIEQNDFPITILNHYFNTAYWPYNMPKIIDDDFRNNSYFIHFAGPFKPWNIGNKLIKMKKRISNEKEPIIPYYSLINDAIDIIEKKLLFLPSSLFINLNKICLFENIS